MYPVADINHTADFCVPRSHCMEYSPIAAPRDKSLSFYASKQKLKMYFGQSVMNAIWRCNDTSVIFTPSVDLHTEWSKKVVPEF